MKYIGINLTKVLKDLFTENYAMLIKDIEGDTEKWKDHSYSWIGRINITKFPTAESYVQIHCDLCENPNDIFHRD